MAWHRKIGGWTRKEAIEREGSLKSEWAAKSKADLALPLFLGPRMADYTRKNASGGGGEECVCADHTDHRRFIEVGGTRERLCLGKTHTTFEGGFWFTGKSFHTHLENSTCS